MAKLLNISLYGRSELPRAKTKTRNRNSLAYRYAEIRIRPKPKSKNDLLVCGFDDNSK